MRDQRCASLLNSGCHRYFVYGLSLYRMVLFCDIFDIIGSDVFEKIEIGVIPEEFRTKLMIFEYLPVVDGAYLSERHG
ncbi:MAG: hypothetical protein J6C99_02435 [Lachnospiraceae bacterium]|nr:hypothetical protein [Lachnospiraceae bacterium]